jgi:16S rRNA (cytosine967-C5)-methyltransferase
VYGIVRWQATLDWLIARKTANRAQKPLLRELLRMGLYQVFWLERIPPHAAVHETVELARREGFGHQAGFVNALLRGYLREADATRLELADLKSRQPHIGYSHPEWLMARWQGRWGTDRTAELMRWNNTPPALFARVNTLKADPAKLLPQWRDEDVEYDFFKRDWLEENLVFELKTSPPLSQLASFRDGAFYIQDPSTLLAVNDLEVRPGQSVLDMCAAPGGKLTYIAQRLKNQGLLVAHDVAPERLDIVRENCSRLGVTCVRTALPAELDGALRFDRILIDAPCSNTGVMRRRVELRWRISLEEIYRLRATQLELLRQAALLLKPGGLLVYSTCSLEPEENRSVVDEFLAGNRNFVLHHARELVPFIDGVDGAYVARMVKQ